MYASPWAQIEDFPDFAVSEAGEVMSLKTKHILTPRKGFNGSLIVNLTNERQLYTRSVGVLVADAFKGDDRTDIFDTVINLNGDRTDCRAVNLAWRPRWFAIRYHRQFRDPVLGFEYPIYCHDTDEIFENCMDAATAYGLLQVDVFNDVRNGKGVWPLAYLFWLHR